MTHRHLIKCRLIVFLALLGLVQATFAREWYFDKNTRVKKDFTLQHPYIEFDFPFFDAPGDDSYFTGVATFYIDDIGFDLNELECHGETDKKAAKDVVKKIDNDGWMEPIHKINLPNGQTFTVRCYLPHKDDDDTYRVTIVAVPNKIMPGETHTVRIQGEWRSNRSDKLKSVREWKKTISMPSCELSKEEKASANTRPAYNQVSIGTYMTKCGHELTHATDGKRHTTGIDLGALQYVNPSGMKSKATTGSNEQTGKITLGLEDGVFDADAKDRQMLIQCSYVDGSKKNSELGETTVYQWYAVNVNGYGKANSASATPNQWNKQIMLNWSYSADLEKSPGSWTVLRKESGQPDSKYQVLETRTTNTTYTDKSAEYDTEYQYMIAFIPTGTASETAYHKALTNTVLTAGIKRNIDINISRLEQKGDDKIAVNWTTLALQGSEKYIFKIYRALSTEDNDGTHPGVPPTYSWEEVGQLEVKDKNQTNFTFIDNKNLQTCKNYYYKVELTALGNATFSSGEGKDIKAQSIGGRSKVNEDDVNASKGDYTGVVKVSWTATQIGTGATKYEVARRLMGSDTWSKVYSVSGTAKSYYYEDNTALPGNYYQYRVRSLTECGEDSTITYTDGFSDGFCRSTGTISGRVSYDQGTAVAGTKVILTRSDGDADSTSTSQFRSMLTTGFGSGITFTPTSEEDKKFLAKDFAIQMLVRPSNDMAISQSSADLICVGNDHEASPLCMGLDSKNGNGFRVYMKMSGTNMSEVTPDIYLREGEFSAITLSMNAAKKEITLTVTHADGKSESFSHNLNVIPQALQSVQSIHFGSMMNGLFEGNIDDIRVFSGESLAPDAILASQDHPLNGGESKLFLYWPLDEGIQKQATAYDYSRTNGVANGRHGKIVNCSTSGNVPSSTQFSLYAVTDSQGNYTLRGVPFSGDGTTYKITPMMGTHSFSPIYSSRFVSGSALVYSGVDFTDNSSFPVSGKARYSGTTIPVEGCMVYVDGQAASKNGKVVKTGTDGTFSVNVPIGKHYIELKKEGHYFEDDGRYPKDPQSTGETFLCEGEIKNLTFRDSTLVNFTGHIVGGQEQASQPVGFGLSNNNIGRAMLTLTYNGSGIFNIEENRNGTTLNYDVNHKRAPITSQTDGIASTAYRGADSLSQMAYIITDSLTGEFSAMLPPLKYTLSKVELTNKDNPQAGVNLFTSRSIDLSDPLQEHADSAEVDGKLTAYKYHTAIKEGWYTPTVFTVRQTDNDAGAFGTDTCSVSDTEGTFKVPIYSTTANGLEYKYDYPIFVSQEKYTFLLKAYQEYVNYDMTDDYGNHPVDIVPLNGTSVQISNALASDQIIYKEDNTQGAVPGTVHELKTSEIELDSLGEFTYTWMAGLPNITSPHTRAIQFYYEAGGQRKEWRTGGLEGIILGSMPTGNNFVTQGPDLIDMILRDPPGTCSSASWTKGTTVSKFKSDGSVWTSENTIGTKYKLGLDMTIATGGIGFMIETTTKDENDAEAGIITTTEGENSTSWTRTKTATRSVSTSAEPEYVGAQGDVFIGSSTNVIFGDAREVALVRTAIGEQTAKLEQRDITTTGLSFDTEFQLTANYIENVLLPNLHKVRDSWLIQVPKGTAKDYVNTGDTTVYVTELSSDDPRFASDNDDTLVWKGKASAKPSSEGPSYWMVKPDSSKASFKEKEADQIMLFNQSINNWIRHLATNEEQKVLAFKDRDKYIKHNLSFDSGSSVTMTQTTDTTKTKTHDITTTGVVHVNVSSGVTINGFGFEAYVESKTGGGTHDVSQSTTTETTGFSYTLAENGDDDALTVDVYDIGSYAPIFRTRGGQTSGPYEGEVRTSYFEPGKHVIMEATQQIEVPEITVDNLKWSQVSGIPTGGAANFTLRLRNNSETGEDVYYKLLATDDKNENGAKLSIDGKVLDGEGRLIKIPATETIVKTLQLEQTDQSVLRYDSIAIVLASQTQYDPSSTWDQIADTVYISADFAPSSSDVHMALDKNVVNTITQDTLSITFSQFDRKYSGLKGFRVQTMQPGGTDWVTLREYVVDPKDVTQSAELLPEGTNVTYVYDMHGLSDGNYRFRVLSVSSYGGKEITRESNEMTIAKDMVKPKPLGMPQPSNGILGIGDDISITFNEEIVKGAITHDDNFEVTAVLNGAQVEHNTALSMQGEECTATTEADIPLAGKSFSTDMWLMAEGKGTLLSHGNGSEKFSLSLDDDLHLQVKVGSDSVKSEQTMPRGSWCYLTVSYEAQEDGGIVNAFVSEDASTTCLLQEQQMRAYNGNGTLAIGKRMTGAIHELTLWNVAHDNAKAQENRQKTKSPSTAHLIGYWKMNEGNGRTITDYARSRHLTSAGDTWYINNRNKAVVLDGTAHLGFPTGDLATEADDNQAIELWLKAGKQQHEAQILQAGDNGIWVDTNGLLRFTTLGDTTKATVLPVTDDEWHHLAINVLRTGNTSIYVDGQRVITQSSRNVGTFNSDSLVVGARRKVDATQARPYSYDRHLTGMVDELRIWNATLDAATLADNRRLRLTGNEAGLVAYFPFETKTLDSGSQVQTVAIDSSLVSGAVTRTATYGHAPLTFTDTAPALQPKPTETNVDFSFTASNEKIVININDAPATIEDCTLNFKVKRVYDANGNLCDPVCWSAYVRRNSLAWSQDNASVTQKAGSESSLQVTVENKGGTQQEWYLTGLPQWLRASSTSGAIDPLGTTGITLTVGKSCPIGKYSETVYLVNSDDIALPLQLNVTVTGDVPDWSVDHSKYSSTMNLIGTIAVHDVPSGDTDDMLGAFINGECRGVAHPTYSKRYDEYFVLLDIACSPKDTGNVEFRIYDASTGMTWPKVQSTPPVSISAGAIYGSMAKPVTLNALDSLEQTMALTSGWNWTSISVVARDMSVPAVMKSVAGSVYLVKNKNATVMAYGNLWDGDTIVMNNSEMYKVFMTKAEQLTLSGTRPTAAQKTITVRPGWNWIAYNETSIASVSDALAAINPEDGDLIKGKQGFAIYDGYEWSGSLEALTPGQGYMYMSQASQVRQFRYPSNMTSSAKARQAKARRELEVFQPTDDSRYPGNMTVVARVTYEGTPLAEQETGVFAEEECRTAAFTDADGIVFLTIPGSGAEKLTFCIPHDGQVLQADVTLNYEDDGIKGNRSTPFEIAFDRNSIATDISGMAATGYQEQWYSIDGIRLTARPTLPGVYLRVAKGKQSEKVVIK